MKPSWTPLWDMFQEDTAPRILEVKHSTKELSGRVDPSSDLRVPH